MHRTDGLNSVAGMYVDPDPATGTPGTEITNDAMNAIQEELCTLLEDLGVTLSKANNSQLLGKVVSAATADTIMRRDENGRAAVADPSAAGDIATKRYVDGSSDTVAAGTGWTLNTATAKKVLGIVTGYIDATGGAGSPLWSSVCTLSAGFRPVGNMAVAAICYDPGTSKYYPAYVQIATTGVVSVHLTDDGTSFATPFAVGVGAVVRVAFSFVAA